MADEAVRLLATQGDRDVAAGLRVRLEEAMRPALAVIEEANGHQFNVGFRFERDAFGRMRIVVLLTKDF